MSGPSKNELPATFLDAQDHLAFTRDLIEVAYMAAASLSDPAEISAIQTTLSIADDRLATIKTFLEGQTGARL